jgi:predicted DNA-binding transcriptional regulator AlpA
MSNQIKLVDTQDIAQFLGASRAHVTAKITKQPDFPAPVINLSQRMRKWAENDIKQWALKSGRNVSR